MITRQAKCVNVAGQASAYYRAPFPAALLRLHTDTSSSLPRGCLHSGGLRGNQGTVLALAEEEGAQALASAELAGHELPGLLAGFGKHGKLPSAHVILLVVLGGHKGGGLALALHQTKQLLRPCLSCQSNSAHLELLHSSGK